MARPPKYVVIVLIWLFGAIRWMSALVEHKDPKHEGRLSTRLYGRCMVFCYVPRLPTIALSGEHLEIVPG